MSCPATCASVSEPEGPTGSVAEERDASVEITILVDSTDPLIGRVVAKAAGAATDPGTDASFMGWLGLLRVLDDLIGSSPQPSTSPSDGPLSSTPGSPPRSVE